MQDRYAGDVGDFGKLGMLRCMEDVGLKVGINWYLVGDESHNNDGKHIGYLENEKYRGCDDELLESLNSMIVQGERSVIGIEKLCLFRSQKYYHKRIFEPKIQTKEARREWHQKGLEAMSGCDLVFLDPPYADGLLLPALEAAAQKVAPGGLIVCESDEQVVLPETAGNLKLYRTYRYGRIHVTVYR